MDDDEIWGDDPQVVRDSEWERISSGFTNTGYREGITAGKEAALQQGFDDGFAQVGAPLGREIGILRGLCSALLAFLQHQSESELASGSSSSHRQPRAAVAALQHLRNESLEGELDEVRAIGAALAGVRFSDIAPPDAEALAHAREHLLDSAAAVTHGDEDGADLVDPAVLNEEIKARRDVEGLEDLMARMGGVESGGGGDAGGVRARSTAEDVGRLRARLVAVTRRIGLSVPWD